MTTKLAILTSHPIQYQTPLFKKLAKQKEFDIHVYFCWEAGAKKEYFDKQFGRSVKWDKPLLGGYRRTFLKNLSLKPSSEFWGQINVGIISVLWKRPDAILIYGWNSFANWLAFLLAPIMGIPILLHGESPLKQELEKKPWKLKIKKVILGRLFRKVRAFLCIGEENKKFYEYYGAPSEKLVPFPYAVDNEHFIREHKKLRGKKGELRKELGLPEEGVIILFTGKLMPKKRPLDLLQAFGRLQEEALLFVGDGELKKELEGYASKKNIEGVHFAGFQGQGKLPKYYAASDIFVLPSGSGETWGLVVNEAMCAELPVVVSDMVGCAPDLVKEGKNGYVFPCGDVEALASALRRLSSDEEKRREFGKRSLEIVQNYSHEKDVEVMIDILRAL